MKKGISNLMAMGVLSLLLSASTIFGQGLTADGSHIRDSIQTSEMEKPKIDGIKQFHDALFPLWHSTLPDSDFQSIRDAAPRLKEEYQKIVKAEIPPYYQHVKDKFILERDQLGLAVHELDTIAGASSEDYEMLPQAVEDVHSAFEEMVRVLAPRTKEVEDFHLVMYPLWHEALPKSDWATIQARVPILRAEMDTLMTTPVPQWLAGKELRIIETRDALDKEVNLLVAACKSDNTAEIKKALESVHSHFRTLDEVFD